MASYDKIDYRLRPAKGVERKMLCELMRELSVFGPIKDYTYIGLGSIYFTDFSLIHKALGIISMHSIEKDEVVLHSPIMQNRFEFNKPFSCIDIHYGPASDHLPNMEWERKAIVWLDYDDPLLDEHLNDIQIVLQNALAGSLILISVNAQPTNPPREEDQEGNPIELIPEKEYRYNSIVERLSPDYLPNNIKEMNLGTGDLIKVYHHALTKVVHSALSERNGNEPNPITAHQLINIRYKDNAEMITFGWLLIDESQQKAYKDASFSDLRFIATEVKPFKIEVPPLTPKEIAWLDAALHRHLNPDGTVKLPDSNKKKSKDDIRLAPNINGYLVNQYVKIYRYFPTFAEAIL